MTQADGDESNRRKLTRDIRSVSNTRRSSAISASRSVPRADRTRNGGNLLCLSLERMALGREEAGVAWLIDSFPPAQRYFNAWHKNLTCF
jgi:hypothetical protein